MNEKIKIAFKGILATFIMSGSAVAGDIDGKVALCSFPASSGMKAQDLLLKFSQDNVTVLKVVEENHVNSEYGFAYNDFRLDESVDKVYVTPALIFWSRFVGDSAEEAASPDDATTSVLMGVDGIWHRIDRYTLGAQIGIQLRGANLHQTGNCEILDEVGEASFFGEYQKMKDAADEEIRKKTEEAKEKKQKL